MFPEAADLLFHSFQYRHALVRAPAQGRAATAICISLRGQVSGNFYHRFTLGYIYLRGPPARGIIIRGIGKLRVSASLCFTRVKGDREGVGRGRGCHDAGKRFRWKVSLQFNFYGALCHFYPGSSRDATPVRGNPEPSPSRFTMLASRRDASALRKRITCANCSMPGSSGNMYGDLQVVGWDHVMLAAGKFLPLTF